MHPAATRPREEVATSRVRYKVLAFAVCLAAITYLDRVCISITAPEMMRELSLSPLQMSFVFSAFTLAYGLFEIPTGWWGDRVGTRRVLTRIVSWWSFFTMATAAAFNYGSLLLVRFLFGVGEAGAWPNAAKTFSRWFPSSERGTAQGIFFMGAHLAGGLTPLLVTALLAHFSWRTVFLIFGAVGFVWAAAWYRWFRDDPAQHASVRPSELSHICSGRLPDSNIQGRVPWKTILRSRSILALCGMYFTQSYGFYFYITWFPTYLRSQGFTSTTLSVLSGLPLILSVAADLLGGLTTDAVSRRYGLRWGRCGVGGGALAIAGFAILGSAASPNPLLSALLIAVGGASANFLLGASWGVCVDIAGRHAGVVTGCMNTAGQIGGTLSPIIVALAFNHFRSWSAPLVLTGALYLAGAACWAAVDPQDRVEG
ncbi:MAG: MFS transporter [Acidobacteria bacterium]|nr:MFS transporter [Acidobacteriota bacterium]MCI0627356.1 MFS transporter [Acidobacteriota bacterium]MCI0723340.1 MFS transporter [Acidobacteriota bacterium]